jgi:hypothetical protein
VHSAIKLCFGLFQQSHAGHLNQPSDLVPSSPTVSYRSASSAGASPAAFAGGSASNRISVPSFKFPPMPEVQEEQALNSRVNPLQNRHLAAPSQNIFPPPAAVKIENGRNEIYASSVASKPIPARRSPVISHQRASSLTNALGSNGPQTAAAVRPSENSFISSTTAITTNQLVKKVIFLLSLSFLLCFAHTLLYLLALSVSAYRI